MLHKLELSEIPNAERNKQSKVITFNSVENTERTLVLKMKRAQEFIEIIKKDVQHGI